MMPQKRRIVESSKGSNKEEKRHFEAYYVTGVTNGGGLGRCGSPNHLELTACHTDYQVYDMSGSLKESPPPCHPATFSFDKWKPTDVILRVGDMVFRAHKDHLSYSCRYFEAMFGNNMRESRTKEITMLDVDETSFRAILTSFYTGFLSVCSQCVLRLLRTGTFLHCDAVNEVCENYLVSHMELGTVFDVFDVTAELGYKRINHHAIKLICNNLGREANLIETEEFLNLTPERMSLLLDDWPTNCTETELAAGVLQWAARAWEWYHVLFPAPGTLSSGLSISPCSSSSSEASLNDSGIVVNDDYFLDLSDGVLDIPSPPSTQPPPPGTADIFSETSPSRAGRTMKTYKRRSKSSSRKGPYESTKRKRKRKEEDEDAELLRSIAQVRQGHREIIEVLWKLEFNNMERESLQEFLENDVVAKVPELYRHIERLVGEVPYRCLPERGSTVAVSLCYHRSYRSSESPSRTNNLFYFHNNRWHLLNNSFNINLISVKSLILNNFLYLFGMQKLPGQQAEPRAFRFNQFTGVWREIAVPPHSFNSTVRFLAYKDTILMIGATTCLGTALSSFQQRYVQMVQYFPQSDTWQELDIELPITNRQLQRYVSSIITHDGLLYYVARNALCSFDLEGENPVEKEVSVISQMFTDISNYWIFAHQDKIVLLGGLCSMQGGGNWQNREVLIYNLGSESWTILQNDKPSPMYEMLTGMVYQDQIYTVSHSASGGDSVAKVELFDLTRHRWKKGANLKYESPVHCVEYGLTVGCMLVKPQESD